MTGLFFLIDTIANPLYLILALIAIWYGYRIVGARHDMAATHFELERDVASRRLANGIMIIILAAQVAVLVLGIQVRAVPFLEAERDLDAIMAADSSAIQDLVYPSPTPADPDMDSISFEPDTSISNDPDTIVLTPTLTPTPVGTVLPGAPPVEGCQDPRAQLQIPANGQRVFLPLIVRGVAYADNFSQSKIEIAGPSTEGQFSPVSDINDPATDMSDLIQFLPSGYEPGAYQFRLMVFDITNNLVAACQVTIYLSDPPTTATPTPNR